MARFSVVHLLFITLLVCFVPILEARKLRSMQKKEVPSLESTLILNALPKGPSPPSSPSDKGHAMLMNPKLFEIHLARIDRLLQSVPSPGAGHK